MVLPSSLPTEDDIASTLDLDVATASALSVTVFLNCMKIWSKLDQACKIQTELELHERKGEKLPLEIVTEKAREDYCRLARSYVTQLFKETRSHFNFTTIIAQGSGSFDLKILLKSPFIGYQMLWQIVYDLPSPRLLFARSRDLAQEEYLCFVDELSVKFAEFDQPTLLIPDTVEFLMVQTSLPTRPLLLRCFKLACLCLDEPFRPHPVVKFGSVNTGDLTSKLVDVVIPVQSYFSSVEDSISTITTDASIAEFLDLESTFGRTALIDTYDPWLGLDKFGRSDFLSKLDPSDKYQCSGSKVKATECTKVQQPPSTLSYSRKNVRPTHHLSDSEVSQSAKNLRQCSSKG